MSKYKYEKNTYWISPTYNFCLGDNENIAGGGMCHLATVMNHFIGLLEQGLTPSMQISSASDIKSQFIFQKNLNKPNFIDIFEFSMKKCIQWVQTSLVLVQWFLKQLHEIWEHLFKFFCTESGMESNMFYTQGITSDMYTQLKFWNLFQIPNAIGRSTGIITGLLVTI